MSYHLWVSALDRTTDTVYFALLLKVEDIMRIKNSCDFQNLVQNYELFMSRVKGTRHLCSTIV